MISKQDLIKLSRKEFDTTIKILTAYPESQDKFTPHERSSDALKLAKTFVFELYLAATHLFGDEMDSSRFGSYNPESVKTVIADFKKEVAIYFERLEGLPEDQLNRTVEFAGRSWSADEFMLMMICDQIHHRGQLSVYVRMAGGKVPSIYGPSADDESTNL